MNCPFKNTKYNIVDHLDSQLIVDLYLQDYKLDVSSYYRNIPLLEIRECSNTKLRYYYPESTIGDEAFYKKLLQLDDYSRLWEFDHQYAFDRIKENEKVLEIGCGSGYFLEKLKGKNQADGIELNSDMVSICKSKGLNVVNESIEDFAKNNQNQYDVICVFQVLEHVFYVEDFLESILMCLKPGGKLFISTPNNDPYYARYNKYETLNLPPHHMTLWNRNTFISVAEYMKFKFTNSELGPVTSLKGEIFYKKMDLNNYKSQNKIIELLNLGMATAWVLVNRLFQKPTSSFIIAEFQK